jgi:hypothetical protein
MPNPFAYLAFVFCLLQKAGIRLTSAPLLSTKQVLGPDLTGVPNKPGLGLLGVA